MVRIFGHPIPIFSENECSRPKIKAKSHIARNRLDDFAPNRTFTADHVNCIDVRAVNRTFTAHHAALNEELWAKERKYWLVEWRLRKGLRRDRWSNPWVHSH